MDRFPPHRRHEPDRPVTTEPPARPGSARDDGTTENTFQGVHLPNVDAKRFRHVPNPVLHGLYLMMAGGMTLLLGLLLLFFALVSAEAYQEAIEAFKWGAYTLDRGVRVLVGVEDPGPYAPDRTPTPLLDRLRPLEKEQSGADEASSQKHEESREILENAPAYLEIDSPAMIHILGHLQAHPHATCYGLLVGNYLHGDRLARTALDYIPIAEGSPNSVDYPINPSKLHMALQEIERRGLAMVGVFRGGTQLNPEPTSEDVAWNYFPDAMLVLLGMFRKPAKGWTLTCYYRHNHQYIRCFVETADMEA